MTRSHVADTLLAQLKNPFDPKFIKWRIGATSKDKSKGIALAYLDAREVMKRLDDVCGIERWQSRLTRASDGFICEIGIKIGDDWVWKSNAAGDTHVEPIKGGSSDALKRAAAVWGVGRYLYYLPNKWVALKNVGSDERPNYVLAEIPELPDWAKPNVVERWEDIAELETDMQGADDVGLQQPPAPVSDNKMAEIVKAAKDGDDT